MLRRALRLLVTLGILGGLGFALLKVLGSRRAYEAPPISPLRREPEQPSPTEAPVVPAVDEVAWVEPSGEVCPTTHPVKAKLSSRIFHLPGGQSYERTKPDRCYRDGDAAEADGLRPAKR